jgi:hypothetical protein
MIDGSKQGVGCTVVREVPKDMYDYEALRAPGCSSSGIWDTGMATIVPFSRQH